MRNRKAFTLIETTFVLALIAALTAVVISRATVFIDRIEVRGAITEIESMFSLARHAAIARGSQVTLDIDAGRGIISIQSGTDLIRTREVRAAHGVSLATNRTSITYSPIGVGYGAANFSLVISRNSVVDTVVVSRLGRVRH